MPQDICYTSYPIVPFLIYREIYTAPIECLSRPSHLNRSRVTVHSRGVRGRQRPGGPGAGAVAVGPAGRDAGGVGERAGSGVRRRVLEEQPDVVLLDLDMPGVDTIALIRGSRRAPGRARDHVQRALPRRRISTGHELGGERVHQQGRADGGDRRADRRSPAGARLRHHQRRGRLRLPGASSRSVPRCARTSWATPRNRSSSESTAEVTPRIQFASPASVPRRCWPQAWLVTPRLRPAATTQSQPTITALAWRLRHLKRGALNDTEVGTSGGDTDWLPRSRPRRTRRSHAVHGHRRHHPGGTRKG